MRKQQGITLIALVITIIVMLILVGVTITLVLNGGLIDRAKEAKNGWESSQTSENALDFNYNAETGEIPSSSGGAGSSSSAPTLSVTIYTDYPGDPERPDITLNYAEGWTWQDVVDYYTTNSQLNTYNLCSEGGYSYPYFIILDTGYDILDTSSNNYSTTLNTAIHSDAHYMYSK